MKGCPAQDSASPSRNARRDPDSGRQGSQNSRHYQVQIGPRRAVEAIFQDVNVLTKHIKMIQGETITSYNKRKIKWDLFWLIFQVNKACWAFSPCETLCWKTQGSHREPRVQRGKEPFIVKCQSLQYSGNHFHRDSSSVQWKLFEANLNHVGVRGQHNLEKILQRLYYNNQNSMVLA